MGGGVPFFLWARAFFWCVVAFFFAQILPEGFPGGVGIPLPAEGNGPQKILPEGFCGGLAHRWWQHGAAAPGGEAQPSPGWRPDELPGGCPSVGQSSREARSSSPASQLQLPGRRRSSRELEPCLRCGSGSTAPEHWGEAWLKQSGGSGLGPAVLICNQIGAFPAFSGFPHHERAL